MLDPEQKCIVNALLLHCLTTTKTGRVGLLMKWQYYLEIRDSCGRHLEKYTSSVDPPVREMIFWFKLPLTNLTLWGYLDVQR